MDWKLSCLTRVMLRLIVVSVALFGLLQSPIALSVVSAAGSGFIAVAPTGKDQSGCGTATLPCATIAHAVNIAASGDVIRLAAGTYKGSGDAVVPIVFGPGNAGKDLTIVGGYSVNNWTTPVSDSSKTVIDGENVRRGFYIVSVPEIRVEVRNLTVQRGAANSSNLISYTGEISGGGLYCRNDNPNSDAPVHLRLVDVVFSNNTVLGQGNKPASGGGVSLYARCQAYLEDVAFYENQVRGGDATDGTRGAHALGGGLFATVNSHVNGKNLVFAGNQVSAGSGGRGWLAHAWDRADALGGGAAFQYSSVNIDGIFVTGNQAIAGGGSQYGGFASGGGLFFEYADALIQNGCIEDNLAKGGRATNIEGGASAGGGIMATDSTVELIGLEFLENRSEGGDGPDGGDAGGGAIYFTRALSHNPSRLIGHNLVLAFNEAMAGAGINQWGGGGAVFSQDTDLEFYHITMVGNSVGRDMQAPGLIALHNFAYSTAKIYYSIIAGHSGRPAIMAQQAGDTVIMDYVLFHENSSNYGSQAGLAPGTVHSWNEYAGDPGFLNPNRDGFDYHLKRQSLARNKAVTSQSMFDIDLQTRPYSGISDLGADEYAPLSLSATPTTDGGVLLRWQSDFKLCAGVAAYEIVVACNQGPYCPPSLAAEASVTVDSGLNSYTLGNLTSGTDYDIVVRALNDEGGMIAESNQVTTRPANAFIFIPMVMSNR